MISRIIIRNYRILRDFEWEPQLGINIIVGDNAAGKSTVLDAIELAMNCRIMGRWAREELSPYWFNADCVKEFFDAVKIDGAAAKPPEIEIELYFKSEEGKIGKLRGVNNSRVEDVPGVSLKIKLDESLKEEFYAQVKKDSHDRHLLPVEYYRIEWTIFEGKTILRTPPGLSCSRVDSNITGMSKTADSYARTAIEDYISEEDARTVSLRYRSLRQSVDEEVLDVLGDKIPGGNQFSGLGFQMDQSSRSDWKSSIVLQLSNIPLSYAGRGVQVEAKACLALRADAEKRVILMEEPESHLSHTSLMHLLGVIEEGLGGRQLFVATHSPFVLNRLGLDHIALISQGKSPATIESLSPDTVRYYQRQSGYDTLRLVLARKVVLVEGPSDEMVFRWAYQKKRGKEPGLAGIDVVAYGTRGKRALELAAAIGRGYVAVLRDNDGETPEHWQSIVSEYCNDTRKMFVGHENSGRTLEPQMISANVANLVSFAEAISAPSSGRDELETYMLSNKTDWAWELYKRDPEETKAFSIPKYIEEAIAFIDGDPLE